MKKTILSILWLVILSVMSGNLKATNFVQGTQHQQPNEPSTKKVGTPNINATSEYFSTDTTGQDERAIPKSKRKPHRYIFLKVVGGITVAFFVFIAYYLRDWDGGMY